VEEVPIKDAEFALRAKSAALEELKIEKPLLVAGYSLET
jgi:hypothetical protein